jgi:hypothetical protein
MTEQTNADCGSDGHVWSLLDEHPYMYDGRVFQCDRCHQMAYRCVDEGDTYNGPAHVPSVLTAGHEWHLDPPPAAPCAIRRGECVRCHLPYSRWPDVEHDWVSENPNPSLSDPEWAMAFGLVEWVGRRTCSRCGATQYKNPSW